MRVHALSANQILSVPGLGDLQMAGTRAWLPLTQLEYSLVSACSLPKQQKLLCAGATCGCMRCQQTRS